MRMLEGRRAASDFASLSAGLGRGVMETLGSSGRASRSWAGALAAAAASAQATTRSWRQKPELRRLGNVCDTVSPVSTILIIALEKKGSQRVLKNSNNRLLARAARNGRVVSTDTSEPRPPGSECIEPFFSAPS